jgi:circadian clock protein KaiC
MNDKRVTINTIPTGVPGLDRVLGGGLPEYSFNMIAGSPGTGKTTLSQQIMYANASQERSVLHFTVLGEPTLKMLRYQQQFEFFDGDKVGEVIRYRDLTEEVLSGDLDRVLEAIVREVQVGNPEIVVVDSFRTLMRANTRDRLSGETAVEAFLQQLSLHLASWEATSFLIGEYTEAEIRNNPVFTVADGILWLHHAVERNSTIRKLQVLKLRGQAPIPGLHTFRITNRGLQVFPRTEVRLDPPTRPRPSGRLATGISGLDAMMGGGIPAGDSILLAGPSGSGKTTAGTHFIAAGMREGERAVIAIFEESPENYAARAGNLGMDLESMVERGDLRIVYLRPLDLSADEALCEIQDAVQEIDASRVLIDSLSGFEIALVQTNRDDFRESLYRMVIALTRAGVTVMMTVEITEEFTALRFSTHAISFLTDDLILQRYVELDGSLRKALAVVKMRGSMHGKEWRLYEIGDEGLILGDSLDSYRGIVSGVPVPRQELGLPPIGLTLVEAEVLRVLARIGPNGRPTLASATGIPAHEIDRALDRLVALEFVVPQEVDGEAVYDVAARSLKV